MKDLWSSTPNDLLFSKNDPEDIRMGDLAISGDATEVRALENQLLIWGYPDDEGIRLNGGRPGARLAPLEIRKFFYKMTPTTAEAPLLKIVDLGNLKVENSLSARHAIGRELAATVTKTNNPWVSLGGGHDYGYSDGSGFLKSQIENEFRPVAINIDAHMDVRPTDKGFNSGTPFRRLLEEFPDQFDFFEVGIQDQCNSVHHIEWAKSRGARILSLNDIRKVGLQNLWQEQLKSLQNSAPSSAISSAKIRRPLWLSLDIDGLTSNEAPGCSQSWTTGLTAVEIFAFFQSLHQDFHWQGLSIYEVSPELDSDSRTSKLAALCMYQFYQLQTRNS